MSTEPNEGADLPKLGSLAQNAREKKLNSARTLLLVVGILTIVVNGVMLLIMPQQVKDAINKEVAKAGPGMVVDQVKMREVEQTLLRLNYLISGGALALGVVFVIFGLIVKQYPVPVTILSLVLYIGAAAVFVLIDPETLLKGIIMKIIIVVLLVKSVQAAIAYENEKAMEAKVEAGYE